MPVLPLIVNPTLTRLNDLGGGFPPKQDFELGTELNDIITAINAGGGGGPWTEAANIVSLTTPGDTVNLNVGAAGELRVNNAPGAAGQVLTSSGAGVAPTWTTPASGTIGGTIAANEIAFGTGIDSIGGDARLTWNPGTGVFALTDVASLPFVTADSTALTLTVANGALPTTNVLSSTGATVSDGAAAAITVGVAPGVATVDSTALGGGALNLAVGELQINGAPGAVGEVLTSNGPGVAPTWQAGGGGGPWQEAAGVVTLVNNTSVVSLDGTNGALASPLVFAASAGNSTIKTADSSSNRLTISGGSNTTGGTGGEARLEGGTSTGTGGPAYVFGGGANVAFVGGAAGMFGGNGTGAGGNVAVWSGAGVGGGNATSGGVDIYAQSPANNGTGGDITVRSGGAATVSGSIRITTGDASAPGSIRLITADGYGGGFPKGSTIEIGHTGATAEVKIGGPAVSDQSRVNIYGGLATFQRVFGSIASANSDTTPPYLQLGRANVSRVSGTSNVDGIVIDEFSAPNTRWLAGSTVTLIFQSVMTLRHNIAPPNATIARLLLAGSIDMATSANTVLGLVLDYDGANYYWQETFRKVP